MEIYQLLREDTLANPFASTIDGDVRDTVKKLIDRVELERQISTDECCMPIDSRCVNDPSNCINSGTDSSADRSKQRCGSKKARVRVRKRKWKPYHKLTMDERRRRDEWNTRRAEAQHRRRIHSAPFNTTQYLMKEHEQDNVKGKEDCNSSEDFYSSPEDDLEFIQKQFTEVYDICHETYINDLSNADLVRELIRLEDQIENLEESARNGMYGRLSDISPEFRKIQVFESEIDKLTIENHVLEMKNKMLRSKVSKLHAV